MASSSEKASARLRLEAAAQTFTDPVVVRQQVVEVVGDGIAADLARGGDGQRQRQRSDLGRTEPGNVVDERVRGTVDGPGAHQLAVHPGMESSRHQVPFFGRITTLVTEADLVALAGRLRRPVGAPTTWTSGLRSELWCTFHNRHWRALRLLWPLIRHCPAACTCAFGAVQMQGAAQRRQHLGELIETDSPRVRLYLGDASLPDANQCAKLSLRQSAGSSATREDVASTGRGYEAGSP